MTFLKLDNISHQYFSKKGYTKALEDISIDVQKGEFISLLGPSGCGKTTLLSIISGLIKPTRGELFLEERPVSDSSLNMGYMLQQDYLFPWKTIKENVLLGPKIQKNHSSEYEQKAKELLKEIGLESVIDSYPKQLSGGMRQRAALARTLITEPKIFLLDEPFSALDYQTKLKLEDLVSNTLKTYQKTSVLVTHDIGEAIAMSDRIILLNANPGRIAKIFEVPEKIRQLLPFDARQHEAFSDLFQEIWKELNALEERTTT